VVLTTGCDKTVPACIMAAATVNTPAIVLSGGPMLRRQVAAAETLNGTASLGAANGHATQLSQSELDALRARLSQCWSPPVGVDVSSDLFVVLHVLFKPNGSLASEPAVVESSTSALGPALADSAKRALLLCQPFTMLKPEHYDQWKDIEVKFDPHELLGG
jgi:colicin import membrane protein